MEENQLTYWKNYQAAMQWVKGNRMEPVSEPAIRVEETTEAKMIEIDAKY